MTPGTDAPSSGVAGRPDGTVAGPRGLHARPWLRRAAGTLLFLGGLCVMLAGAGVLVAQWYVGRAWATTEAALDAGRQLDAPAPRWLDEIAASPTPRLTPTPRLVTPTPPASTATVAPAAGSSTDQLAQPATASENDASSVPPVAAAAQADEPVPPDDTPPSALPTPTPEPRASADAIEIVDSEFRFLDPPEPGAQARVGLLVRNRADLPTGPLRLSLPSRWLSGWRVLAADPPVLDDQVQADGRRAFDFPGLDADTEGGLELHLVATDDAVDPPDLRLSLAGLNAAEAADIGSVRPETVAPRPRPGPARAVEIPRLGLRSAVVPTVWEPPNFVVGQLRQTANLSEGNTVLIGHLTGLAGNVFAHLDQLQPGDEIVATSRGLEYRYVVSEMLVLPGDDSIPIQPTDEARLTLMTCAGDWDPINHDYSHRLWIVAEPPEVAAATLAGDEPGPLTRLLGLAPALTIVAPTEAGPSPKELAPDEVTETEPPVPTVEIDAPADEAVVGERVTVRGRRTVAADPSLPLWLAIRAEIEGSRWFVYERPLAVAADGTWSATVEVGGGPGIRHALVVAAVDTATDARLRRQVSQRPGEPLSILPDAFDAGARITVARR